MKIYKSLYALIIGASLLTGCRKDIQDGEVYEKHYEPERNWVQIVSIPHVIRIGKTTITKFTLMPIYHHDDEDYVVSIKKYDSADHNYRTRTLYLTPELYKKTNVGDYMHCTKENIEDYLEKRNATEADKKKYGVLPIENKN